MKKTVLIFFTVCTVLANATPYYINSTSFFAPTPAEYDGFGYVVAANLNIVAVSTRGLHDNQHTTESYKIDKVRSPSRQRVSSCQDNVYLYNCTVGNDNAPQCSSLNSTGLTQPDSEGFGYSLAWFNEYLFVGAPFTNNGAVYIYDCANPDSCIYINVLTANFSLLYNYTSGYFGFSVAINNYGVLAIGAPKGSDNNGAVFFYQCTTTGPLNCTSELSFADPDYDYWGDSLSILTYSSQLEYIVVGAPYYGDGVGAVFVYRCDENFNCTVSNQIEGPDDGVYANFGEGVSTYAISSTGLLAVYASEGSCNDQLYIYQCSSLLSCNFTWQSTVYYSDGSDCIENFGYSLVWEGPLLIIGAPVLPANTGPGIVIILNCMDATNCQDVTVIENNYSKNCGSGEFGYSLALTTINNFISLVVGAPACSFATYRSAGEVFVYTLSTIMPTPTPTPTSTPTSTPTPNSTPKPTATGTPTNSPTGTPTTPTPTPTATGTPTINSPTGSPSNPPTNPPGTPTAQSAVVQSSMMALIVSIFVAVCLV